MFSPEDYTTAVFLLIRLLGLIYVCAFGAFIFQMKGLFGKNGILPIASFFGELQDRSWKVKWGYFPSLFWVNTSDKMILAVPIIGTLLGVLLVFGIFPSLMLFLLFILYLSLVSAGQDFLGFGWEGFLLEITIHVFLLSLTTVPNSAVWISINFLLFRFYFQAGAVKLLSRDGAWRDLSALAYHYQTQPIPNTIAWFAHKLPLDFQRFSSLSMFAIELVVPFGIFLPDPVRLIVFIFFVGLQFMIWLTGNFSFLNHLTAFLCVILLNNQILSHIREPSPYVDTPFYLTLLLTAAGSCLLGLQIIRLWASFWPNAYLNKIISAQAPFHLANRYGIFAVMTKERYEIVIEGSDDNVVWHEYLFKHKPSELTRRPRRIAPYQPRLDWQTWFLPFTDFESEAWFQNFLYHLLKGTPEVLQLIRYNPFPDHPPLMIRVRIFLYEFSSWNEKQVHGWWWRRKYIGMYTMPMTLKNS